MKQKDLHVVFGSIAKATLIQSRILMLQDIELISLEDCLNIGPLCDIGSTERIEKRKAWFLEVFGDHPYDYLDPVDEDIKTLEALIRNGDKIDKIFLWTGYCSSEIISTARLLKHLLPLNKMIYIIDFSNIPVRALWGGIVYPKLLSVTEQSQVDEVFKHFYMIENDEFMKFVNIWDRVMSGSSRLRVLEDNGNICEKEESYFDTFLMSHSKEDFQKAARVIGHTLSDIDFGVDDRYLNWRLKQLALSGKIKTRGRLGEIRDYEVRKLST